MTHRTDTLFGWYSAAQDAAWGGCVYLDEDGAEIRVTAVTPAGVPRPGWPDAECVGRVTEFLRRDPTEAAAASSPAWASGRFAPPQAATAPRAALAAPGQSYLTGRRASPDDAPGADGAAQPRTAGEIRRDVQADRG